MNHTNRPKPKQLRQKTSLTLSHLGLKHHPPTPPLLPVLWRCWPTTALSLSHHRRPAVLSSPSSRCSHLEFHCKSSFLFFFSSISSFGQRNPPSLNSMLLLFNSIFSKYLKHLIIYFPTTSIATEQGSSGTSNLQLEI